MNPSEFFEHFYPEKWTLKKIDVNGEEGLILLDDDGEIIPEQKFNEMILKAKRFYDSKRDTVDIEQFNRYKAFNNDQRLVHNFPRLEIGKAFKIPEPKMRFKPFRADLKRKWSCKCALCGTKVSSDKDEGYYLLDYDKYIRYWDVPRADRDQQIGGNRACSSECGKVLWKAIFKEWITDSNYQEFFIME